MTKFLLSAKSFVFSNSEWLPDKVETLTSGVTVVNTVVSEVPCRFAMNTRAHADLSDDAIRLTRIKKCIVRCIVT